MTTLFIVLGIILAIPFGVFIYFFIRKNDENVQDDQFLQEEPQSENQISEIESLPKNEKTEETVEEMTARLNKIKNPDQEKPFAKMSKPQISEILDEMIAEAPANLTENIIDKPRKKRPYKKKTPKKTEE
jgi:hypothetical protein